MDLLGQVNAEYAGGRQISGTGGSVDFMRAAKVSKGGRSIVAMNATARGGAVSRIVPRVDMVTALRTDVDIVVTEFGVAQLQNLPNRQRAGALIDIAAPQFRDELRSQMPKDRSILCQRNASGWVQGIWVRKNAYSSATSRNAVKRPD